MPLGNAHAVDAILRKTPYHAVDLAPTFRRAYARQRMPASRLAEAYARSIADPMQHRELFQQAATMPSTERRALIAGYRRAGEARGVVHAMGNCPVPRGA